MILAYWFSGWAPYAYFRALEDINSGARVTPLVDGVSMQTIEIPDLNQQSRRYGSHAFRQVSSNSLQEDVEYGKM